MASFELPKDIQEAIQRATQFRISPALQEAMAAASKFEVPKLYPGPADGALRALESVQQALASVIGPTIERWQLQLPKFGLPPSVQETLDMLAKTFVGAWERAMPANWTDLDSDEVLETVERVREAGFALVWVPRVEIVRAVLAVDAEATGGVLLANRNEILSDAEECLTGVLEPELQLMRIGVEKSVEALRDGHDWAAQALAAAVFTSEAHMLFDHNLGKAKQRMAEKDPHDVGISQLRLRTIFMAGAKALGSFRPTGDDVGVSDFNRHNSAHRITAAQWNELNALSAVMLATALLREIEAWYPVLVRDAPDASA